MNKIIIETLDHITVCYYKYVESVKLMIQEHYDTPEYDNTIIFINILPNYTPFYGCMGELFSRRIYYFLEHKVTNEYYNSRFYGSDEIYADGMKCANITEMWTMDYRPQFAYRCEELLGIPVKYVPVRYTSLIKPVENIYTTPKGTDLCLVGCISKVYTPLRYDFMENFNNQKQISLKIVTQTDNIRSSIIEMNTSKYIIDIPREIEQLTQNQVRIFELLCMGYTVCVKKSDINIFPGLIYEWNTVDDLINIVKNCEYLSPAEAYKEMTYSDEAYNKYVNNLIKLQS